GRSLDMSDAAIKKAISRGRKARKSWADIEASIKRKPMPTPSQDQETDDVDDIESIDQQIADCYQFLASGSKERRDQVEELLVQLLQIRGRNQQNSASRDK
ncbi:MAG: hypothetical protein V3S24_02125, partial [Candidatus Tectomicrobia bacterium]